jgi:Ser/Thr protein kinase RdoA (MazF antagonist)
LHRHAATLHNGRASASALKEWDAARMCGGSGASDALVDVAGARARDVVAFVKEKATEADAAVPPHSRGLVNGDIGPHNIVWHDAVPGFFDFNDTGIGSFAFDLARYLRTMRWRAKGDALVAAALEGYESVRPLPDGWHGYGHVYEAASSVFLAGYLAPTVAVRGAETAATVIRLIDEAAKTVGM